MTSGICRPFGKLYEARKGGGISELEGTAVASTVVVILALDTGPTAMSHKSVAMIRIRMRVEDRLHLPSTLSSSEVVMEAAEPATAVPSALEVTDCATA